MSHGFRGTSVGPARQFVDFEQLLNKEGFCVLRFDQPNSGNSGGDFVDSSFTEWVQTIVYFAKKYIELGYSVSLLGQSMGATATVIATNNETLRDKIPCVLLWVPDPKSTFNSDPNTSYEEAGQKYKGTFWKEAKDAGFFKCLEEYEGGIHLVYGEQDKFISQELREQVIQIVKDKQQQIMILPGQDHSPWEFDLVQHVYEEELVLLKTFFK